MQKTSVGSEALVLSATAARVSPGRRASAHAGLLDLCFDAFFRGEWQQLVSVSGLWLKGDKRLMHG